VAPSSETNQTISAEAGEETKPAKNRQSAFSVFVCIIELIT